MRCCITASRAGAVNAACAGQDERMIWPAVINAVGEIVEGGALRLAVRLHGLLDLAGEAADGAAVIAAQLLQRRDPVCRRPAGPAPVKAARSAWP